MTSEIVVTHWFPTAAAVIAVSLLAARTDSGATPGPATVQSHHQPEPPLRGAASGLLTRDSSGGIRSELLRRITAASVRVGTARLRHDGRPALLAATPANPATRTKRQPDGASAAEPLVLARMFDERSAEADMLP